MEKTSVTRKRVAIVGGGIAGLSAAWYLQKQAQESNVDLSYTIFEQSGRWGGKVYTEQVQGLGNAPVIIEAGPDSFLTQKPYALQLARELGLSDRLLGTNDHQRHIFVLNKGKPVRMPEGVLLIVPTRLMPFALSPLISPWGKLRMGCDLFIPRRKDQGDETIADFVKRRLGSEALDKIAEPMMSGIYNAEAERQSLHATFPRFQQLEQAHGSLIRGMLSSRGKTHQSSSSNGQPPQQPVTMFMSLDQGMQGLIDRLVGQLSGQLRCNTDLTQIIRNADNTYTLVDATGQSFEADILIIATPAYVTARLIRPFAPKVADQLDKIRYVSTGTISLAFRKSDLPELPHGFGVVIPQSEKRSINAITISSTKFNCRAPDDYVLMRIFFGGSRTPAMMILEDGKLLEVVRGELKALLGIQASPVLHRIYRWYQANPQYDINHLERIQQIEDALPTGLYVTGSAYRGVGLPDCVYQSRQCIQRIFDENLH